MAGRGYRFSFHGAFNKKAEAERRERARTGTHIRQVRIHGKRRYLVAGLLDNPGPDIIRVKG